MLCPCGKKIESTSATPYQIVRYDNEGNIIYAICVHGYTIEDKELFDSLNKEKLKWITQ